jgi:hypothetical protein
VKHRCIAITIRTTEISVTSCIKGTASLDSFFQPRQWAAPL